MVEELTEALINKVLHTPIRVLKEEAAVSNGVGSLGLIRKVFGLSGSPSPADVDAEQPSDAVPENAAPTAKTRNGKR